MIERKGDLAEVQSFLRRYPVVGIVGARQVGKTTLARMVAARAKGATTFFDLENPDDLARLAEPMLALKDQRGLIVIDEVQRRPDLLPVSRVLADRPRTPAWFLVLGSASPALEMFPVPPMKRTLIVSRVVARCFAVGGAGRHGEPRLADAIRPMAGAAHEYGFVIRVHLSPSRRRPSGR